VKTAVMARMGGRIMVKLFQFKNSKMCATKPFKILLNAGKLTIFKNILPIFAYWTSV
jgi:hypothetical protein